jgi:hypothetical protein
MNMSSDAEPVARVSRREAIRRLSALLGGVAFVGGHGVLAACEKASRPLEGMCGAFTAADIAFLDEIAETILPATKTPGAKAAKTGAFMAIMVTDSYRLAEQKVFRDGMRKVDDAMRKVNNVSFLQATPPQRLAVLAKLDHEQKRVMDAREAADRRRKGLAPLPADKTAGTMVVHLPKGQENVPDPAVSGAAAPDKEPAHYFRMMKELALLGYFTSELGCTQAMRYIESPGRFDPCIPYSPGEPAWAAHA